MKTIVLAVLLAAGTLPAENIARGKKYSMSALPAKTWEKSLKTIPDYDTILTDGETESGASFWVSPKCVNFLGIQFADIIVDLGSVEPIAEVAASHGARTAAGVFYPSREEYFVSDDGIVFFKAGEYSNVMDPAGLYNADIAKGTFTSGVTRFTSGPIRTKGRYVLVRTHVSMVDYWLGRYVGYDEIIIEKGDFPASAVTIDTRNRMSRKPVDIPADALGYRIKPLDWNALAKEHPVHFSLAPMQMIGDDEYHLSAGGVFVMLFTPVKSTGDALADMELTIELPDDVRVISRSTYHPAKRAADGRTAVTFTIKKDMFDSYMRYPYLVVTTERAQGRSDAAYRWKYTAGGKPYAHEGSFTVIYLPAITALPPKRFMTGFWMPYQTRYLEDLAGTADALLGFYRAAGFTHCKGTRLPEVFAAGKKHGLTVLGAGVADNGMMISGYKVPDADRFIYHASVGSKRDGVCPTRMYADESYRTVLKERIVKVLAEAQHIYANWEPYMFQKLGCVCDRCREEYKAFTKKSESEMANWQDAVTNKENDEHNRFSSYQYANIIRRIQSLTREAGEEMNLGYKPDFVIAYEPSYVTPGHSWARAHDHHAFYKDIDSAIAWSYPNTVYLTSFSRAGIVGNTLTAFVPDIANINRVRRESGHPGGPRMPRTMLMPTDYFDEQAVLPRDFYMTALLSFFDGLEGYGTWSFHFKQDARYVGLQAKANRIIAELEDIVLDGIVSGKAAASIASPVPKLIGGREPLLTITRAFVHNGALLAAVANDYPYRTYQTLRIKDMTAGNYRLYDEIAKRVYQKDDGSGFSAAELAAGVTIAVEGKEWAALAVRQSASGEYDARSVSAVQKKMQDDLPFLKEMLENIQ